MRIGILTGGGDVPGLNPCIKAAVFRAIDEGHEMVGIRRGWGGFSSSTPMIQSRRRSMSSHWTSRTPAQLIAAAAPFCTPAAQTQAR
jgi:6-phosphofructokinase